MNMAVAEDVTGGGSTVLQYDNSNRYHPTSSSSTVSAFIFLRLLLLPRHNNIQNKKMNMHTNIDNRNKRATTTFINIPVVVFHWIHIRHIHLRLLPEGVS